MTRKLGMQISVLSLLALLSACGGRVTDKDALIAMEPGPHAGGASDGGNAGSAAARPKTGSSANRTNNGGSAGSVEESAGGSTTKGSGGSTNGNGRTLNGSGGAADDDAGATTGNGASLDAPTAQVWVGYLQLHVTTPTTAPNYADPQHIVVVLNPEGAGDVGSVILGDAAPPRPPTDPNAFYPPDPRGGGLLAASDYTGFLVEGVSYSLLDVRRTDTRLTFHLNPAELYKDWCKLRTACSTTPVPEAEYAPGADDLCPTAHGYAVCDCEDSRCRWSAADPEVWTLELELRGSFLEGQILQYEMSLGGLWAIGIRLKRVE